MTHDDAADARDRAWWRLALVSIVWLVVVKELPWIGDRVVPDAWKRHVEYSTFLMLCQVVETLVGLGLAKALVPAWRERLGLVAPRALSTVAAAMLAPMVFVVSSFVALEAALPTLLAEADRGAASPREIAGGFGRALEHGSVVVLLVWTAVLAAVSEELVFRGALFGAVRDAVRRVSSRSRAADISAVLVSGLVFGAMHADMPGGLGIVRVVSTTLLGLACGAARVSTKSLAAPLVLHLANNVLTIGQSRGWFGAERSSLVEWLPARLVEIAAWSASIFVVVAVVVASRRKRAAEAAALGVD